MPNPDRTSISKAAALSTGMRWIDRLIGLISTLILARILVPEDFGIIAMASLVVGLLDVLLDLGVHVALIQNRRPTQSHYDTAWTLRLLQNGFAVLLILLISPLAGDYFGDERVVPVLQWMSVGLLLAGLENIGVVQFQKEMQFGLDFRFTFLKRVAGFLVTIVAALVLRSYWALVIGTLAGRAFGVMLSYQMHSMRPRLELSCLREIFGFSQWILIRNLGSYLNNNLHRILVGRRASATTMGGYTLADEISAMPSSELLAPINRALFPAFVEAKHDAAELKRLFLLAQGVQTLIGIPASVGLALVAEEAIALLLGDKWLLAAPFVQLLALANIVHAITTSGSYVMITLGRVRDVAILEWTQVALFSAAAFALIPASSALELAWLRVLTVATGLVLAVWILMRVMKNLRLTDIAHTVVRPVLGALVMACAIAFGLDVTGLSVLAALSLKVAVGLAVYPAAVLVLWYLAGRPAGAESYLLGKWRDTQARIHPFRQL